MREHAVRELRAALERHGGNVTHAARDLGMKRQNFYKVAKTVGLDMRRKKKGYDAIDLRALSPRRSGFFHMGSR